MTKKKLKRTYIELLNNEMDEFIRQTKMLSKDEIIACAYRISTMKNIYEYLLNKQDDLSKSEMKQLLKKTNIIREIYYDWLKFDVSDNEELYEYIEDVLKNIYDKKGED